MTHKTLSYGVTTKTIACNETNIYLSISHKTSHKRIAYMNSQISITRWEIIYSYSPRLYGALSLSKADRCRNGTFDQFTHPAKYTLLRQNILYPGKGQRLG